MPGTEHKITIQEAPTLSMLFWERVKRSADKTAYIQFDVGTKQWQQTTWGDMANEVGRWQAAMQKEGLESDQSLSHPCGHPR